MWCGGSRLKPAQTRPTQDGSTKCSLLASLPTDTTTVVWWSFGYPCRKRLARTPCRSASTTAMRDSRPPGVTHFTSGPSAHADVLAFSADQALQPGLGQEAGSRTRGTVAAADATPRN